MDLERLRVEVLEDADEIELAGDILSRHHYCGSRQLQGERMHYVVKERGQRDWVAILFFDHVTLHTRLRDEEIGWSVSQREERQRYLTNNSRFFIFPAFKGVKNLGSKILSLVEGRICGDWQRKYGHPIFVLETYVDPDAGFEGSCYKGAGWTRLGLTKGWVNSETGEQTSPKYHFLKPLHKDAYAALRGEFEHPLITGTRPVEGSSANYVFDPNRIDFKSLKEALSELPDPRSRHGRRYEMLPILTLSIAAVFAGYTQYRQIRDWIASLPSELRAKAGLRGDRKPSESMLGVLFRRIDSQKLDEILNAWLLKQGGPLAGKLLSLDGKHQRATHHDNESQKRFLNVMVQDLGIVIRHVPVPKGSSEHPEGRRALEGLNIEGATVVADAIHTNANTAEVIAKKKLTTSSLLRIIIRS